MRCVICGEQWDLDSLHEEVSVRWPDKPWMDTEKNADAPYQHKDGRWHNQKKYETYFHQVVADFKKRGCIAISESKQYCKPTTQNNRQLIAVTNMMMGDDVDEIQSMLEDAESMGLFD